MTICDFFNLPTAGKRKEQVTYKKKNMIVKDYIVYRIVNPLFNCKVGDMILPHSRDYCGEHKRRVEQTLQVYKPSFFPSRKDSLFVCFSKENANEWAVHKWGTNTEYKLLTLSVTGDLFWLKAEYYNNCWPSCSDEMLINATKKYWDSNTEDIDSLTVDHEYEGLFVGDAKVIGVEIKKSYKM